jgi:acyl-CoA hydrolase
MAARIGRHVSSIVEDGSTIQVGYGSMPNAILSCFGAKRDLGVHTELLSDGIAELMKAGAVDNTEKSIHQGRPLPPSAWEERIPLTSSMAILVLSSGLSITPTILWS